MTEAEMIEAMARAMMNVCARRPAQDSSDNREFPVLSLDPDFDDLPTDSSEGTIDDEITQEAVLRLASAALDAIRDLPLPTHQSTGDAGMIKQMSDAEIVADLRALKEEVGIDALSIIERLRSLARCEHDDLSIGADAADAIEYLHRDLLAAYNSWGNERKEMERLTAERNAALADCDHWRKDYTELQTLHLATDELLRARTMERDAAMAWFRAVEKTGSALCQTFDLATPAEEALRDVLTTACSLAEFEAFRAGAEAMREALRLAAIEKAEWFEARRNAHASERGSALRYFLGEIKHTPLPAHLKAREARAFKLGRDSAGRA